jgi:putative transposase
MHRLYHERLEKKAFKMSIVLMLRDLPPGERAQKVKELTEMEFDIPFSQKRTLGKTTLYDWLQEYRQQGACSDVLLHKERSDRKTFRSLTQAQKNTLMRWRHDNPYRTASQLREELIALETEDAVPSECTIARFLRSVGLDRSTLLKNGPLQKKVRLAYEAPYPQRLWIADTKGPNLSVVDPEVPQKVRIAKPVVYIDDNSRYLPIARYIYEDQENEETVLRLFMEAVSLFGVPDTLYLDRGGAYMGLRMKKCLALLGCRIIRTGVRDASAKGKVEKMMRFFFERLESELMTYKEPLTLEAVNEYMAALIRQDYHRTVHSETGETPEERFFSYPAEYRRFVSKKALSKIFLPYAKSRVSKTGLIHLNRQEYLVPDASLYGKYVEVRFDTADPSMVYVWHEDRFAGEAVRYVAGNDFIRRCQLEEGLMKPPRVEIPAAGEVPPYAYLERKLAAHRAEMENMSLNDELVQLKTKRAKVKAELIQLPQPVEKAVELPEESGDFTCDRFIHLLSILLRRRLGAHERLAVSAAWQKYGPFPESMARRTVGTLLGEGHAVSDLTGYLDALRLAAMTEARG